MRGGRTWRRAARRRSARANAMLPRVASHDRLSPEWSANRAAACRAGKVEPQRAFLHIALLETLLSSLRVHGTRRHSVRNAAIRPHRSEEHTSELQSPCNLV